MRAARYLLPSLPVLLTIGTAFLSRCTAHRRKILTLLLLPPYLAIQGWLWLDTLQVRANANWRLEVREWVELHAVPGDMAAFEPYVYDPIGTDKSSSLFLRLPLSVTDPHIFAPIYDLRWYESFTYVGISSSIYERYQQRAAEFPQQIDFYRQLENSWVLAKSVQESEQNPVVLIYRNPTRDTTSASFSTDLYTSLSEVPPRYTAYFLSRLAYIHGRASLFAKAFDLADHIAQIASIGESYPQLLAKVYLEIAKSAIENGDRENVSRALREMAAAGGDFESARSTLEEMFIRDDTPNALDRD